MKKRVVPVLLAAAVLALTACGGPGGTEEAAPAASLPETAPQGPISISAEVLEGRTPAEPYDLPTQPAEHPMEWYDGTALLAETPDQTAAFYSLPDPETEYLTALVRWGDSLAEFDWAFATPQGIPPRLWCFDADGDGEEELAAVCCTGTGTGVSVYGLHVVEKHADGTLTDYAPPWTALADLTDLLRLEVVEDRAFAVLGTELVDITSQLPEDTDLTALRGLVMVGDIVSFDVTPTSDWGERIRFRGSAWLDGAGIPPTVCYVVEVTAVVTYQDGVFTLSDLHLNSSS